MKKSFVFFLFLVIALAGCGTPLAPYDQLPGAQNSSSQNYRATANAALQQADWQDAAMTATAQAPIINITETAAALAMQQQLWTTTAQSVQETQIAQVTGTAQSIAVTSTVAKLNADNQVLANAVARDNLALQRQANNNAFVATMGQMAPLLALAMAVGLTIIFANTYVRKMRYQPAKVDERGNVLPMVDIVDRSFIDIDRSPNFRGKVSDEVLAKILAYILEKKFGIKPMLPEVTAKRQDGTTERDQMIDLATRGLPATASENREQKKLAGQQMMQQLTDSTLQGRFKILDENTSDLAVVNGDVIEVLDQDWKEAEKK